MVTYRHESLGDNAHKSGITGTATPLLVKKIAPRSQRLSERFPSFPQAFQGVSKRVAPLPFRGPNGQGSVMSLKS